MILLELACGHRVESPVAPRQQYPEDVNYVWCPSCRPLDVHGVGDFSSPMAWNEVTGAREVPTVPDGTPRVGPLDIMRVQPRLKGTKRVHPFPYR